MALPDIIANGLLISNGYQELYKSSGGDYYVGIKGSGSTVDVYKNDIPGTNSWAIQDSTGAPTSNSNNASVIADDNGFIHFVGWHPTNMIIYYHRFNTNTDNWDYINQQVADLTGMSAPTVKDVGIEHNPSATNEEVRIFGTGLPDASMGTDYQRVDCWTCNDTGAPSFQGPFSVDATSSEEHERLLSQGPSSTGARTHIFWGSGSDVINPTKLNARTLDAGTGTLGFSTIRQHDNSTVSYRAFWGSRTVSFDDSGTGRVVFIPLDINNDLYAYRASEDASKDIGTLTESSSAIETDAHLGTIGLVQEGGTFYTLYANDTDRDIYISDSTDDGATWSTPTVIVTDTAQYINARILDTGKIAYFYRDISGTFHGAYNEYTIPGNAYSADLTTGNFKFTSQSLTWTADWSWALSTGNFKYTSQDLTFLTQVTQDLTAASFGYTAQDLAWTGAYSADLSAATFGFTAQDLSWTGAYSADLTTATFGFTAQDLTFERFFSADLTAASFTFTAQDLTWLRTYTADLTAASFGFTAQDLTVAQFYTAELSAGNFQFAAQDLTWTGAYSADLTAATFGFTAQDLTWTGEYTAELTAASFGFTAQDLTWTVDYTQDLTAADFKYAAQDLTWLGEYTADLTAASFGFTAQDLTFGGQAVWSLDAASFGFTAQALTWVGDYSADLSAASFGFTAQDLAWALVYSADLTAGDFKFSAQDLTWVGAYSADLTAGDFKFSAQELTWTQAGAGAYSADLTATSFGFTSQDLTWIGEYTADLTAASFGFSAQDLTWMLSVTNELTTATFAFAAQDLLWFFDYDAQLATALFDLAAEALTWKGNYSGTFNTPNFSMVALDLDAGEFDPWGDWTPDPDEGGDGWIAQEPIQDWC